MMRRHDLYIRADRCHRCRRVQLHQSRLQFQGIHVARQSNPALWPLRGRIDPGSNEGSPSPAIRQKIERALSSLTYRRDIGWRRARTPVRPFEAIASSVFSLYLGGPPLPNSAAFFTGIFSDAERNHKKIAWPLDSLPSCSESSHKNVLFSTRLSTNASHAFAFARVKCNPLLITDHRTFRGRVYKLLCLIVLQTPVRTILISLLIFDERIATHRIQVTVPIG